jgi:hypothetical protein
VRETVGSAVGYAVARAHCSWQNDRGSGGLRDESAEFVALECVSSIRLRQAPRTGFEFPERPCCVLLLSRLLLSRLLLPGLLLCGLPLSGLLSCLIRHGHFSFFESYCYFFESYCYGRLAIRTSGYF